ncbi:hypothetical protein [Microvirga tunisiensis]|uniref:Uncharacterized protein n=1 Tax=Microvirga tunisiensis TaxID=2108360 RepID=A0A5N7MCT9_9HYPH|nr:hypothetical protein [Microvirga tunisiensis]MPR06303.1 hypothetical protein [Microvirga tunisiensis]MPR24089.1 hypothetical protein [Microvirga tunisiensis]
MKNITRHAVRIYAAVSSLKEGRGDVLDALIPFMEPILEAADGKIYDPHVVALGLRRLYGWRVNRDVAEFFAERLLTRGYLQRVTPSVLKVSYKPEATTGEEGIRIAEVLERITDEFQAFAPQVSDIAPVTLARKELKDLLIGFLVSLDAYTEQAFSEWVDRSQLDIEKQNILEQLEEGGKALTPELRYLCARFLRDLVKDKPEFVPHLARLASAGLLAEVVEDFVKPTTIETRSDLVVVLDAPVALNLLGLSGAAARDDIRNVVESLRGIGCSFIVLPVSCDEMSRNLASMLRLPLTQRHGPTYDAMRKGEVQEDYVRAVMNDPQRALEGVGVTVRPVNLTTYPYQIRHFSEAHYEELLSDFRWQSIDARDHDATSTALTMRLRAGNRTSDLFRAKYVFVTTNPRFERIARDFCIANRMIGDNHVPPVVLQREVAMAAWLRTGFAGEDEATANVDIPRSHLIASCERVLRTRKEVTEAVHRTLSDIAPDRLAQFELLMSDQRSVQRLMDETLGEERLVTPENIDKLWDEMRRATAAEIEEEYRLKMEVQKAALAAEAQAERERVEAALKAEHAAAAGEAESKRQVAEAERQAAEAALREQNRELERRAALLDEAERDKAALALRVRENHDREVAKVEDLMVRIGRGTSRTWTVAVRILVGLTLVSLASTIFGWTSESVLLQIVGGFFTLAGSYHTFKEFTQEPKLGLRNLLDRLARKRLRAGFRRLGIDEAQYMSFVKVDYGRLTWDRIPPPPALPAPSQVDAVEVDEAA